MPKENKDNGVQNLSARIIGFKMLPEAEKFTCLYIQIHTSECKVML